MANALKSDPPIFLGSVLGIDLELQDRPELPCLVKHPAVSRESTWHRAARPEDGFQAVEQSCYWEVRDGTSRGDDILFKSSFGNTSMNKMLFSSLLPLSNRAYVISLPLQFIALNSGSSWLWGSNRSKNPTSSSSPSKSSTKSFWPSPSSTASSMVPTRPSPPNTTSGTATITSTGRSTAINTLRGTKKYVRARRIMYERLQLRQLQQLLNNNSSRMLLPYRTNSTPPRSLWLYKQAIPGLTTTIVAPLQQEQEEAAIRPEPGQAAAVAAPPPSFLPRRRMPSPLVEVVASRVPMGARQPQAPRPRQEQELDYHHRLLRSSMSSPVVLSLRLSNDRGHKCLLIVRLVVRTYTMCLYRRHGSVLVD